MKPVIALVGRPNVGKSTLFNRLTRSRAALVADVPGLTRDRNYGLARCDGRTFVAVDTGGMGGGGAVEALMEEQALRAVAEADRTLLLVDARAGVTAADQAIAARLRRGGRPLALVINKAEGLDGAVAAAEFHALGLGAGYCVSAAHGAGIDEMMRELLAQWPPGEEETPEAEGVKIAIVGRPNVGKSTLVNRLLGEARVLASDEPGTTRDSIFVPFERDGQHYVLIDTAGVRRRSRVQEVVEKFSVVKTLQAIAAADVVVLVLDARQGVAEQDARLLGHVLDSRKAVVIAVNKWDGLEDDARRAVRAVLERKLRFIDYARMHFISALHGSGVGELFRSVEEAHDASTQRLATPQLTRLLHEAVLRHAPPLVQGRRIKLRYAHQGGENPPLIVIHGNQTQAVPDGYRRYLENFFREALHLVGTPLGIEFRRAENPFKHQRNVPTRRQTEKRRRLKRFVRRKGS